MGFSTSTKEWLELYDKHYGKFKWFIEKYFPGAIVELAQYRENNNQNSMLVILNDIWFELPDGMFNIMVNPPGWTEFLELIED